MARGVHLGLPKERGAPGLVRRIISARRSNRREREAYEKALEAISLRVDRDVLAWFRAQGPRYQSRMNAVLRTYVAYVRKRVGRKPARGR